MRYSAYYISISQTNQPWTLHTVKKIANQNLVKQPVLTLLFRQFQFIASAAFCICPLIKVKLQHFNY